MFNYIRDNQFSDDLEPQIDSESGLKVDPIEPVSEGVMKTYWELLKWAEERRKKKFANPLSQFKAMKMARNVKITREQIKEKWLEMEEQDYWIKRGFDFHDIISQLDKKQK